MAANVKNESDYAHLSKLNPYTIVPFTNYEACEGILWETSVLEATLSQDDSQTNWAVPARPQTL